MYEVWKMVRRPKTVEERLKILTVWRLFILEARKNWSTSKNKICKINFPKLNEDFYFQIKFQHIFLRI
jgi:hypothetical protein